MNFEELKSWLSQISLNGMFAGHTVRQWVIAIAVGVVAFLVLPIIIAIVRKRAERLSKHRAVRWLAGLAVVLHVTRFWFLLGVSIWLGSLFLVPPRSSDPLRSRLDTGMVIVLLLQAGLWATALIQFFLDRHIESRLSENPAEVTTMSALGFLGKLLTYVVIALLIMENLGMNVTALLAGLGVGGIAVALAAQNILGDLFSSMSIILDKPFVLGDFVSVGDISGTVDKIGLKTTRIRSLSGEQVIFSNSDLLSSRIKNFKRMAQRRVVFSLGVTYDTPREKLEAIPNMIRETIEAQEQTRFDRSHFASYGDSALLFESVYYVLTSDYNIYMNIHQAINLDLFTKFANQEIEFAFPTQTLYVSQTSTPGEAPPEKSV